MKREKTLTLDEARERLRTTIEEYIRLDAELRSLENTNYRVCIFGSARIRPQEPLYREVFRLAQNLSQRGIDVVTGGGPGLMEAANRGVLAAKRRRSQSYGLPLDMPTLVEPANRHLDFKNAHKRFSSRLDEFIRLTHAAVIAPGGIGTLLELMYVWQLMQLDVIDPRPMVMVGREYWSGLLEWMREKPAAEELINPEDLDCVSLVDTPEEVLAILDASHAAFLAEQRMHPEARHARPELSPYRQAADELAASLARDVRLAGTVLEGLPAAA